MKTIDRRRTAGAAWMSMVAATCIVLLPACDPATLSPEARRLVTGTSDVGEITLTVTPCPGNATSCTTTEVTVVEPFEVSYHVRAVGFTGTLFLSLSGLTTDVELLDDLDHNTPVEVAGNRDLDGTFTVRALRERADPIEVLLNLTSVGTAGSRVNHPPARIRLLLRPGRERLDLDCSASPRNGGLVPVTVTFTADPSGCLGRCEVSWFFEDDRQTVGQRTVTHTFTRPAEREDGTWHAEATLDDGPGRSTTCLRAILALPGSGPTGPNPSPSPTSPGRPAS